MSASVIVFAKAPGRRGLRLHRAFARHLMRHGRALPIGTDAASPGAVLLRQASRAQEQHEGVFVPPVADIDAPADLVHLPAAWHEGLQSAQRPSEPRT